MAGGQVINAEKIENFPGFPEGISGFDLGPKLQEQATAQGLDMKAVRGKIAAENGRLLDGRDVRG